MYSTYDGAKRRAKALASFLSEVELETPLHVCQRAVALAGGYRDWDHLRRVLKDGVCRPASLERFLDPLLRALPLEAVGPANRWAEGEISQLDDKSRGREPMDREWVEWHQRVDEYAKAIGIVHRAHTPLLRPGSGAGQKLRLNIVDGLCMGRDLPSFDRRTYVLTFEWCLEDLMPDEFGHPHFEREFIRLQRAGILEWDDKDQTLRLNPPPIELVRERIAKFRRLDAEYWLGTG